MEMLNDEGAKRKTMSPCSSNSMPRKRKGRGTMTAPKGDRMRAKVLTHRVFDPTLNCVVVKARTILRVIEYSGGGATQMPLVFVSD